MRALHYAAYFDVPELIRVVLQASQPGGERIPAAVGETWKVVHTRGRPIQPYAFMHMFFNSFSDLQHVSDFFFILSIDIFVLKF